MCPGVLLKNVFQIYLDKSVTENHFYQDKNVMFTDNQMTKIHDHHQRRWF